VLEKGIDERSVLVSLGGGAVCNVCGFIASTLYRGVGLIHVPTTLMAQCDASISHKQALNGRRGKNLVGAYYAPIRIVVDVNFLATLEDWLIPDGLAEVLKHALGQDKAYLDELFAYDGDIRAPEFLERVIKRNIELKCELMAVDPKEHAAGMVLQYGHNVGHAVEYLSGYELSHGEAIAIGMMVSARTARLLGGCDDEMVELHRKLIAKYQLPTMIPATMRMSDILDALRYDKKYLSEGVRMALLSGPGELWQVKGDYAIPVSEDVLTAAIEATMERA
jgi:3-dehydroquinate synthase